MLPGLNTFLPIPERKRDTITFMRRTVETIDVDGMSSLGFNALKLL